MIKFVRDMFRRRRLRLIVEMLPYLLKHRYGASEFFTADQVRSAATQIKIKPGLIPMALATACSEKDFLAAEKTLGRKDYRLMRREIARLFWLDETQLNCRKLTAKFPSTTSDDSKIGQGPDWPLPGTGMYGC